jgi:hypothetical protein
MQLLVMYFITVESGMRNVMPAWGRKEAGGVLDTPHTRSRPTWRLEADGSQEHGKALA